MAQAEGAGNVVGKKKTSMGPTNTQTTGSYTPTSSTKTPSLVGGTTGSYTPTINKGLPTKPYNTTSTPSTVLGNTGSVKPVINTGLVKPSVMPNNSKPAAPAVAPTINSSVTGVQRAPLANNTAAVPGAAATGTPTWQMPKIGDMPAASTPQAGTGAPSPVVGEGAVSTDPTANGSGNTLESSAIQTGSVIDSIASIGKEFAAQSDEHAVAVAAQYSQMVSLLDSLEAQILGQIKGQMNGDDPGLQAALGIIKEEALRMRDESLEDLNARGLVQSGVYAEMLSRLNKGELTQIQQVVGQRFGDLQNQLNSAMMNMAQARISAMGSNQSTINNMMMNDRSTQANIGMKGAELGLTERGQNIQNTQFNANLGQQKDLAVMQNETQRYGVDTSNLTQRYGIDVGAMTSKYGTDTSAQVQREGQDITKQGQQLSYNASIYGSNVSANNNANSLAYQNRALEWDMENGRADNTMNQSQFEYTKSYNAETKKSEHLTIAKSALPQIIADVKAGSVNTADMIAEVKTAFEPTVAAWMITQIEAAAKPAVNPNPPKPGIGTGIGSQYTPSFNQKFGTSSYVPYNSNLDKR